jgi:oxygen-dependent protoporphyrinogen oxidase
MVADLPSELDAALARCKYSPFLVAGIFTRETGTMPWDDLYAVAVPGRSFCMFFNPANALRTTPRREPGGALVVYAVARRAELLLELTDEEIRTRYLDDLYAIFPAARGIISEVIIQRWHTAVAVGFAGRAAVQAKLNAGYRGIFFGGDYMIPPGGIDASESGRAVAAAVQRYLQDKTLKE